MNSSHGLIKRAALTIAIVLASTNLSLAQWKYYFFDEARPLTLDDSRIAIFEHDLGPMAAAAPARATLLQYGISSAEVKPHAIQRLSIAGVPPTKRGAQGVRQLVKALAADGGLAFVSPVFLDERGLPLMILAPLHVGFHDGISAERAEAILAEMGAGEIEFRNWSNMKGVYRLQSKLRDGFEVLDLANRIAQRPEVKFAEPDMVITGTTREFIPNDPFFSSLWGLHNTGQSGGVEDMDMDAPAAWDLEQGDPSIIVAVMDTGVQQDHPDINQIPGFDATGSGTGGGPLNECDGHGTTVAGTISAIINNGIGVTGIAPNCKVAGIKFGISNVPCDGSFSAFNSWLIDSLQWAEDHGVRVTNNSTTLGSSSAQKAKYESTRDGGMVHFTSSGNGGGGTIFTPGSWDAVNAVGALTRIGTKAGFSQFGPKLTFSAPGQSITTTDETGALGFGSGDIVTVSGTSYASPYAAGVAALILSSNPTLNPDAVEGIMAQSSVDLGDPGWDTTFGWGFLNAHAALLMASPPVQPCDLGRLAGAGGDSNQFGAAVSTSGNVVVVGAPNDSGTGTARVFRFDGATWTLEQVLAPTDTALVADFGRAVSVDGDVIAIGAPLTSDTQSDSGAVYLFRRDTGTGIWNQEQKIASTVETADTKLGAAVVVFGNLLAIGVTGSDCVDGAGCGSVLAYAFDGIAWGDEQLLTASNEETGAQYGGSLSIHSDRLAVGSPFKRCSSGSAACGSAYVYEWDGSDWGSENIVTGSSTSLGDRFGRSVSLFDDTLAVGAPLDDAGAPNAGTAFVFRWDGAAWVEEATARAAVQSSLALVGSSVSIRGDDLLAGARLDSTFGNSSGTVLVFRLGPAGWTQSAELMRSDAGAGDEFGTSVSLGDVAAAVGSLFNDTNGLDAGAAYTFAISPDCNRNSVPDLCDIRDGTSFDLDLDGEPDECRCPTALALEPDLLTLPASPLSTKNRYISFQAIETGTSQAIRVTFADMRDTHASLNGTSMWVGIPEDVSELGGKNDATPPTFKAARLVCDPVFVDWSLLGTVHVFHENIVPGSRYFIQAIDTACSTSVEADFSSILVLDTSRFGDLVKDCISDPCGPPDGFVNLPTDLVSILDKFKGLQGAPIKARCDLEPRLPDGLINVTDFVLGLEAFKGLPFPFPPAAPCP